MANKTLILLSELLVVISGFLSAAPAFAASNERVLYSLCPEGPPCKDGFSAIGGVIFDSFGNLYGTAYGGGTHDSGTVYELSPGANGKWNEKLLHTFNNTDGSGPEYGMTFGRDGNLYGTTFFGGPASGGVVFQLTPGAKGWTEQVLHNFADGDEGFYPVGALVFDANGNLYGATNAGGSFSGAIYQLSPSGNGQWSLTVLHSFDGGSDGANPAAGVIFDSSGNLYGTTYDGGGSGCGGNGCGTVFELSPGGHGNWSEKVLYSFNGVDGSNPSASLIIDGAGNLYGTTYLGGMLGCNSPSGCGTVFELSPGSNGEWTENILHYFYENPKNPTGTLIFDGSGNLYGTTSGGGTGMCNGRACGRVFKLTLAADRKWTYSVLHSFGKNSTDGNSPYAGLVFDSAGNLYGTTAYGGAEHDGTVFEITP